MRSRFPLTVILLLFVVFCVQGGIGISQASSDSPYLSYLPILSKFDPAGQPRLISPTNGAVLDTLIPDFRWNTGVQPPNTSGCLGLSTTPHPGCWLYYTRDSNVETDWLSWGNLEPNMIYYWRVGAVYNDDYDHPYWSEEWSFRSGPAKGTILPAPNLLRPADNAVLNIPDWVFTWTSVKGAVEYTFTIQDNASSIVHLFFTSATQEDFRNMIGFFELNKTYQWYVRARNNYAWGPDSIIRNFQVSATQSPGFSPDVLRETLFYQYQDHGQIKSVIKKEHLK